MKRYVFLTVLSVVAVTSTVSCGQRMDINGTVLSLADNKPVVLASVFVNSVGHEVHRRTVTDMDGKFSLQLRPEDLNDTLVFSHMILMRGSIYVAVSTPSRPTMAVHGSTIKHFSGNQLKRTGGMRISLSLFITSMKTSAGEGWSETLPSIHS